MAPRPANNLAAVVLAAGKGTRMHSDKPKVLHTLLDEPMLWYVLEAMHSVTPGKVITVVGHQAGRVQALFPEERFVLQDEQLGTGHALQCAWAEVVQEDARWCLVVNGDAPLIDAAIVGRFCEAMIQGQADLGFITCKLQDPQSYGRLVRDEHGQVLSIVEAKDYDPSRHGAFSGEVNAGVYLLRVDAMGKFLSCISADNQQQEYYLTELVELAAQQGSRVLSLDAGDAGDVDAFMGVNSPMELASAEEKLRQRIAATWLDRGVTIHFPSTVCIGPSVELEPGADLKGPCELYGRTVVGSGAVIESHTWIKDSRVAAGSLVRSFSHLEKAIIEEGCVVGPFARLRPEAYLEAQVQVGNFVELK